MEWYTLVNYTLRSTNIVLQIVALFFLWRSRLIKRIKNQVIIITGLCVCEMTGAVFGITCAIVDQYRVSRILSSICNSFGYIFFMINYYFIMTLLTIDRFLVFYLNVKYHIRFPPAKVLKMIQIVIAISLIPTITFAVLILLVKISLEQLGSICFVSYLIFDAIYILIAIATYTYIFKVYKRQVKMRRNSTRNKENFNHLIPGLIIITFITFAIIPDFYNMTRIYKIINSHETIADIASVFYRVGWMVDPLIYIFFSNCQKRYRNYKSKSYSSSTIKNTKGSCEVCWNFDRKYAIVWNRWFLSFY